LITRLSYLLSEPSFLGENGAWHDVGGDPAWLSLSDQRTRWQIHSAPEGRWRALRFSVGLPPALNDRDPALWPAAHPLNPSLNGLHWSWQGGYIFLALEGRFWHEPNSAASAPGFAFHLAREPFRATVELPVSFEIRGESGRSLGIEFDVGRLIDGSHPVSFSKDGASTHSKDGDPLASKLHRNLPSAFRPSAASLVPTGTGPGSPAPVPASPGPMTVPATFPRPDLPADLLLSPARIDLGRRLFHETKFSRSGTLSCASCHFAGHALSDPRRFSVGEEGRTGNRNAMPLFNLAWKPAFFWDGRAPTLRAQIRIPIEDHRELDERLDRVLAKLSGDASYPPSFEKAFGDAAITGERLAIALETFLLTLVSHDSKFDRYQRGEADLTELERRGFELFMTEREPRSGQFGGDCFHCHGGPLFTDHQFRNNGLGIDPADPGRATVTGVPLDRGAFMTPSLRNVALTAPYMHDGRFATLEEVLDHYGEGVERTPTLDPNLAKHPDGGLGLTKEEKAALAAFLRTLTDDQFAREAYANEADAD
jgi:cytochrome c peroxidase